MRKELYLALMAYANEVTLLNRLQLRREIQKERIDAIPEEDARFAEIVDTLENKPTPAYAEYDF